MCLRIPFYIQSFPFCKKSQNRCIILRTFSKETINLQIFCLFRPGFRDTSAFQPFAKGEEEREEEREEEKGEYKRATEEQEEDSEGDEMVDIERIEDKEEDRTHGGHVSATFVTVIYVHYTVRKIQNIYSQK
jgi:hypothetical protein